LSRCSWRWASSRRGSFGRSSTTAAASWPSGCSSARSPTRDGPTRDQRPELRRRVAAGPRGRGQLRADPQLDRRARALREPHRAVDSGRRAHRLGRGRDARRGRPPLPGRARARGRPERGGGARVRGRHQASTASARGDRRGRRLRAGAGARDGRFRAARHPAVPVCWAPFRSQVATRPRAA
jgi:hypothetical protein